MSQKLSASEWTQGALKLLAERGVDGLRVERLAPMLGVTKGSFYWHFADRAELLDAVLVEWRQVATDQVIEAVERASDEPAERLRELIRLVFRVGGPLDRAVRAWGTHDQRAAKAVSRVDARRYRFVCDQFEGHGLKPDVARIRARLLYTAFIGEQHASLRLNRNTRVEWALRNLELLLGDSKPGANVERRARKGA